MSPIASEIYGMIYGMKRTTIYLPDEMKIAIEQEAVRRGVAEAEVIRAAVGKHLSKVEPPIPRLPVFPEGFGAEIGTRVNELLEEVGEDR